MHYDFLFLFYPFFLSLVWFTGGNRTMLNNSEVPEVVQRHWLSCVDYIQSFYNGLVCGDSDVRALILSSLRLQN